MSLPVETSLFDAIAPRIKCMRASDLYVEIDVTGISVDQDKLVSYFNDIGWVRIGRDTDLCGRLKTQEIFDQLMKAWNSIGFYTWEFKFIVK